MSKTWGTPTWNLLHCISLKANDDYFSKNKDIILEVINLIFKGLPCPDCSEHAVKTFSLNKNKLKTKDNLQKFLHYMHNDVNKRLKQKMHDISILEQYEKYDMKEVLEKWVVVYKPSKNIPKLMGNNMHINFIRKKLIIYFKKNLQYY